MKLNWVRGNGPGTTQELAVVVESEGRLGRFVSADLAGLRCLLGVICDCKYQVGAARSLSQDCEIALAIEHCWVWDNDNFYGTPGFAEKVASDE